MWKKKEKEEISLVIGRGGGDVVGSLSIKKKCHNDPLHGEAVHENVNSNHGSTSKP